MAQTLHVFSGNFSSGEEARAYSEEQWEQPAPDDSWSDEAYAAWEDRNPTWTLDDDLDVEYMDSDFIETIRGGDRLEYLETQLADSNDGSKLRGLIPVEDNTLVLIMSAAFDGKKVSLSSTPKLRYHGQYLWNASG